MNAYMHASWLEKLEPEFYKPYMKNLEDFLAGETRAGKIIYPPFDRTFAAFCHTPFDEVKVVIMGQDPYHGMGQAHGLSFSVPKGIAAPPSLQNIFKELAQDVGMAIPTHGCLESWAKQGVLLLNATLSVKEGEPKSHYGRGWEQFTDRVIQLLCERKDPIVFILWGKSALEKCRHVGSPHLQLISVHPSPLSAYGGFFGSRPFSKANEFLKAAGKAPINWSLT